MRCIVTEGIAALRSDTPPLLETLRRRHRLSHILPVSQGVSFIRRGYKMQNLHRPVNRHVDRRTLSIYHPQNRCYFSSDESQEMIAFK